jgi:hypothetical protein
MAIHALSATYATAAGARPIIVHGARYATRAYAAAALAVDCLYSVGGIRIKAFQSWQQWGTVGTPLQIAPLGARWATQSPLQVIAPFDQFYATIAPLDAYLLTGERWATLTPAYAEAAFPDTWYFRHMVARAFTISYPYQVRRAFVMPCPIGRTPVRNAFVMPCPMLTRVAAAFEIKYAIVEFDTVARSFDMRWSLLDGATIAGTEVPTLAVQGRTLVINDLEIAIEEGQYAWTCQVTLPNPADLALFGDSEPFTITLGGEAFEFIRTETRYSRQAPASLVATVSGLSPSVVYADPNADKVSKTWNAAVLASAVFEELFGVGVVELRDVLDWSIPAGRLAVTGQTPVEIAAMIARATGGLLESDPDGALYLRPAWPVSVPFLESVEPDQTYDTSRDLFTTEERMAPIRLANRFRILDVTAGQSGLLAAEIDSREDGYNAGRTQFAPGDQPALLIFRSTGVTLDSVRPSAGNIAPLASGTMTVEETLAFADSAEATLRYPTNTLTSWKWLGNDLGTPEIVDELTLRVPAAGVAELRVVYETTFDARRLSGVPAVLNGETEYDVLVLVEGTPS